MARLKVSSVKKKSMPAPVSRADPQADWQVYFDIHIQALFTSLARLLREPLAFGMTVLVLAVNMALASSFYLIIKNFQQLSSQVAVNNQISVFLKPDLNNEMIVKLMERMQIDPRVQDIELIPAEQGMADLKTNNEFGAALDVLAQNPLPALLLVTPKATESEQSVAELIAYYQKLPEVDLAKSDREWFDKLDALVNVAQRIVWLLATLFACAELLIIGNTTRLELQSRREEILIMQLLGATNAFLRRSFLYTGFWLSFLGSVLAWFIVTIVTLLLRQPIHVLAKQYTGQFSVVFLDYTETFSLIAAAMVLGVLAAWLVLARELQRLAETAV